MNRVLAVLVWCAVSAVSAVSAGCVGCVAEEAKQNAKKNMVVESATIQAASNSKYELVFGKRYGKDMEKISLFAKIIWL